ncbi:MAG: CPBP family intramembrane metalloprotease [Candidatus Omnitrophica bacterium]|nr:CPBP family intramembrane metalloprotease [Candidatus Omnitrophota bacterium]
MRLAGLGRFLRRECLALGLLALLLTVVLMPAPEPAGEPTWDFESRLMHSELEQEFVQSDADLEALFQTRPDLAAAASFLTFLGLGLFSAGIILNIIWLVARIRRRPESPLGSGLNAPGAHWSFWDAFRLAVLVLGFGYLLQSLGMVAAESLKLQWLDENAVLVLGTSLVDILVVLFAYDLVVVRQGLSLRDLGIAWDHLGARLLAGFKIYAFFVPILLLGSLIVAWVADLLQYDAPTQAAFELLYSEERGAMLTYSTLFVVLMGPVSEEIFFRGVAYPALKKYMDWRLALVLGAALFSVLHGDWLTLLPITLLGIALTLIYERTGSLIPGILIHSAHNLAMVGGVFLYKELARLAAGGGL